MSVMSAHKFGNIGLLPCTQPVGNAITVSLKNFFCGNLAIAVDERWVVQTVEKIIWDLDARQHSR
jgi:hypothetical protein